MSQGYRVLPLRDTVRELTSGHEWAALSQCVGGSNDDAIRALSGEKVGRLLLAAEVVSKSLYAEPERALLRRFQKVRAEALDVFEARRKVDLVLKGVTAASSGRAVTIPADLLLEFDFATGSAHTGDIHFHQITARIPSGEMENLSAETGETTVRQLEAFFKSYIESCSSVPSMDASWKAAREAFVGKHVSRARVRELHRKIIPAASRKPGPRK
jgi:hypothetical protein